jgi:AcrR family transcriptional regulator
MPRKYDLGRRAAAADDTRRRIVDATVALHAEQGVVATSYKDVARRADVGIGTVYNHFPTLDDLITACGSQMRETTRPPDPEVIAAPRTRRARVELLVANVFGWYERYPSWRRGPADADRLESLARAVRAREDHLRTLVRAALDPDADELTVATLRALIDYEVFRTLTDAGLTAAQAADRVVAVLRSGI